MRRWLGTLAIVVACGKSDRSKPEPIKAEPSRDASVVVPVAADAAVAPTKLPREGPFIFAATPGARIPFVLDDGTKTELADGTVVTASDGRPAKIGEEAAHIAAGDKIGTVASKFIVEGPVITSPSGEFSIVETSRGCGDYCHEMIWLVRGSGARWMLSDNSVRATIAWHPKGIAVAIDGEDGVVIADLPSGTAHKAIQSVESPAYAPDGTLYLRDREYNVLVVAGGDVKVVGHGVKPRKDPNDPYDEPIQPVTFDAAGKWHLPAYEQPHQRKTGR